jgi:hypothetical protein
MNFGINNTRLLGCPHNYRGTLPSEREVMMDRRGVPSNADRLAPSQVIAAVRAGRPCTASFKMSMIPYPYRRHSFTGLHEMAIVAVRAGTAPDAAIMDPNYGWPDGKTGWCPNYIWMPYSIWAKAFVASGGWCVIPAKAKVLVTRRAYVKKCTVISSGVNIRSGPGTNYTRITTFAKGVTFTSVQIETRGGPYLAPDGRTRNDWLSFVRSGKVVWIARAFVHEA